MTVNMVVDVALSFLMENFFQFQSHRILKTTESHIPN